MTLPELRVGQIWLVRDHNRRIMINRFHVRRDGLHIVEIANETTGNDLGEVEIGLLFYKRHPTHWEMPNAPYLDLTTLLYDPEEDG